MNSDNLSRTLIYIPIIHNMVEMGSFGNSIRQRSLQKLGRKGLDRKVKMVNGMWTDIERIIDGLSLSYPKVRLYQDGLPVCGHVDEIVTELAKAGSRNYQLLLRLKKKGATIMGTESSELLVEEYQLAKQLLTQTDSLKEGKLEKSIKNLSYSLLKRRDIYIAEKINTTLQMGETGILFLGMLHSVENLFEKNIRVIYPIDRPSLTEK